MTRSEPEKVGAAGLTPISRYAYSLPVADSDTYSTAADLLPIGEAARLLGVSVDTIRRWDRDGRITSIRTLGGQRRFRRADVDRVLSEGAA